VSGAGSATTSRPAVPVARIVCPAGRSKSGSRSRASARSPMSVCERGACIIRHGNMRQVIAVFIAIGRPLYTASIHVMSGYILAS
jgi:hypothetical protein